MQKQQNILYQSNLEALEESMFIVSADTFKRLEKKTQVITAAQELVRTRLTHSLEVSSIGNYIAEYINTNNNFKLVNPATVENVGKIHDIGHAPFGHVGADLLNKLMNKYDLDFEDNANSLVILEKYYPRLTKVALLSTIKYPFLLRNNGKKGLYDYQEHYIKELQDFCDKQNVVPKIPLIRTYESQIMELADDIAYLTGDLEDFYIFYNGYVDKETLSTYIEANNIDRDMEGLNVVLNILEETSKNNIVLNTWLFRKHLIRNIIFNKDTNKIEFDKKWSIEFLKLLRQITTDLYIKKYSIKKGDKLALEYNEYLKYLFDNVTKKKVMKKEINSKRLLNSVLNTFNTREKIIFLGQAISEMTDRYVLKRMKKLDLIK